MARTRQFRRASFVFVLGVLGVVFIAACGGDSEGAPTATSTAVATDHLTTTIRSVKFESPLKVNVGTEVTWLNEDVLSHNVISKDNSFKSGNFGKGDMYSYIFSEPGEYKYQCTLHPGMDGVIEVE